MWDICHHFLERLALGAVKLGAILAAATNPIGIIIIGVLLGTVAVAALALAAVSAAGAPMWIKQGIEKDEKKRAKIDRKLREL